MKIHKYAKKDAFFATHETTLAKNQKNNNKKTLTTFSKSIRQANTFAKNVKKLQELQVTVSSPKERKESQQLKKIIRSAKIL